MPEPWYIQDDLHDGWEQRETDYQLHLLEQTLANHAAFDAHNLGYVICPNCGDTYPHGTSLCPPCNKADRTMKRRERQRQQRQG